MNESIRKTQWRFLVLGLALMFPIPMLGETTYQLFDASGNLNSTDFYTGGTVIKSSTWTVGGTDFSHAVKLDNTSSISGVNDSKKYILYNVKTTKANVTIVYYNVNTSSNYNGYYTILKEGSTSVSAKTVSVAKKSGTQKEDIEINNSVNTSLYIHAGNTNVYILQVKVVESGDPLPMAGQAGYSLNFNKGRMSLPSGKDVPFEGATYQVGSNYGVVSPSYISFASGKTVMTFTAPKPVVMAVTSYNKKAYSILDSENTIFTSSGSSANDSITLPAGSYSVKTGGSGVQWTKLAFLEYTPISSITLNPTSITLGPGSLQTLVANISPANASDKSLLWSSSDNTIATVDAAGKVTAVGAGTATITAQSKTNATIKATASVTVEAGCVWQEIIRGECKGGSGSTTATGTIGGMVYYDGDSKCKLKEKGKFYVRLSEGNYFRAGDTLFFDVAATNDAIALNIYSFDASGEPTKRFQIPNVKSAGTYYFVLPASLPANTYNALGAYRNVDQENISFDEIYVRRMSCDGCDGLVAPTLTSSAKKITVDETCKLVHSPLPSDNFLGAYSIQGPAGNTAYVDPSDSLFHADKAGIYTITWTVTDKSSSRCALSSQVSVRVLPTICEIPPIITPVNAIPFTVFDKKRYIDLRVADVTSEVASAKYVLKSAPVRDSIVFTYADNELRMTGRLKLGVTAVTMDTLHFVFANTCEPEKTFPFDLPIRILPETMKPRVAVVITGTQNNDDFSTYSANDSAACAVLKAALEENRGGNLDQYQVTFVNGYATKDSATIMDYYQQYDVVIITDFLDTQKGYTNALGVLVDKKPVLTFEAFVAKLPNWHVSSDPKDPDVRVTDMNLLCSSHVIFKGIESDTIQVLTKGTTNKGLNAFAINEAPNFLFLATIDAIVDGVPQKMITCCERQEVFTARMIIYGIQNSSMMQLTNDGKRALVQMVDYLLSTDDAELADCGLVFDNDSTAGHTHGGGDGKWSNPHNWGPNYNRVPTAYDPVRVIYQCVVDVDTARAASVKLNQGFDHEGRTLNGSLVIEPTGGLTVASFINKVKDTRYANLYETSTSDVVIKADKTGNGALVFGNDEDDVYATVQYYSKGTDAKTDNPVWQYMGTPLQEDFSAVELYYGAWMCRWQEESGMGGLWQWVENYDPIVPFTGYCISQTAERTYTLQGRLNKPVDQSISLMPRDAEGYAFVANSWVAPIKVQELLDADFMNADKSVYIYHSGTYAQADAQAIAQGGAISSKTGGVASLPGQYAVVPIHSSPYITGADSVIPSMQGFFVKTNADYASLSLNYNRVVYDAKYFKTSTVPMRSPSRTTSASVTPDMMRIWVASQKWADQVHVLSHNSFSEQYLDGWDGSKLEGDTKAPMLALQKEAGEMAVACVQDVDNHYLQFRAGEDSLYTMSFDYSGDPLWMVDQLTGDIQPVSNQTKYTFRATNSQASKRFLLTRDPQWVSTGVEMLQKDDGWIIENYQHQPVEVSVWDMQGRLMQQWNTTDNVVSISDQLPVGVYTVRVACGNQVIVNKLIGKEGQL